MKFISKKYLLSALLVCASISSGFTSDNPYDKYFYGITDTSELLNIHSELQDKINEYYNKQQYDIQNKLAHLTNYDEKSKLYDSQYELYDEQYAHNNSIYEAFTKSYDSLSKTQYNDNYSYNTSSVNPYDKFFIGITDKNALFQTKSDLLSQNNAKYHPTLAGYRQQFGTISDYNARNKIYDLISKVYDKKCKEQDLIYEAADKWYKIISDAKHNNNYSYNTSSNNTSHISQAKPNVRYIDKYNNDDWDLYSLDSDSTADSELDHEIDHFDSTKDSTHLMAPSKKESIEKTYEEKKLAADKTWQEKLKFINEQRAKLQKEYDNKKMKLNNATKDAEKKASDEEEQEINEKNKKYEKLQNEKHQAIMTRQQDEFNETLKLQNNNHKDKMKQIQEELETPKVKMQKELNKLKNISNTINSPVDKNNNKSEVPNITNNSDSLKSVEKQKPDQKTDIADVSDENAAPILLNTNSSDVAINKDSKVDNQVSDDKNAEESKNNEVNEFDVRFKDCKSENELNEIKEKLLQDNELQNNKIEKKYDNDIEILEKKLDKLAEVYDNAEQSKQIEQQIEILEKTKEKELDKIEKEHERIEKAYDKAFTTLFTKNYNELINQYKNGELKLKNNAYDALLKINDYFFYSCEKDTIKEFITVQNAVKKLVETESKNSKSFKTDETIKKLYEIISNSTEQEIKQLSMLYSQIQLSLSGGVDSIDKIDQTFDRNMLYYLLFDYNDDLTLDAMYYSSDIKKELRFAIIHDYFISQLDVEEYIKALPTKIQSIFKQYVETIYKLRITKTFDNKINTATDEAWKKTYIDKNNQYLKMLDDENITQELLNETINELTDGKYLEAIDMWIKAILKLSEMNKNLNKAIK